VRKAPALRKAGVSGPLASLALEGRTLTVPLGTPLEEIERRLILETLRLTGDDKNLAAKLLDISTRTIYRKLNRES
jgi:two-component system response regulator HydG